MGTEQTVKNDATRAMSSGLVGRSTRDLEHLLESHYFLAERPSIQGIDSWEHGGSVAVGIGITAPDGLGCGLPLDAVAFLLTSEDVRRAVGADQCVVLLADSHATDVGSDNVGEATALAQLVHRQLEALLHAFGLDHHEIVSASEIRGSQVYEETLRRLPGRLGRYQRMQIADAAWLRKHRDVTLKVGWTIDPDGKSKPRLDERVFDELIALHAADDFGFVYTIPGRSNDPSRGRVSPYNLNYRDRRFPLLGFDDDLLGVSESFDRHQREASNLALRHLGAQPIGSLGASIGFIQGAIHASFTPTIEDRRVA